MITSIPGIHRIIIFLIVLLIVLYIMFRVLQKEKWGEFRRFYAPFSTYPFLRKISEETSTIRKELEHFIERKNQFMDWPEKDLLENPRDEWTIVPLHGFGTWHSNCGNFPETTSLLKQIPSLRTAIFSRLGSKTQLKYHQGWSLLSNNVLRCHLGIIVPKNGKSGVGVEGEKRNIKYGEWIVFDDSKLHTGFNESNSDRIVLLLDIDRPWWVRKGISSVSQTPQLLSFLQNSNKPNSSLAF